MTPEQWTEIEAVFDRIADLSDSEREKALEGVDPEVRANVARLIAADKGGPAIQEAIREGEQLLMESQPLRFSNYRVEGVIGHGGMGTVYKAVRDDQAFDKQVAIKVLQLGSDTPRTRERFQQERRILAGLEHPNIARLIDGGETEQNLSYIVLEYVDGEDILSYCNQHKLSREARMHLFIKVCNAVQYAHQNLIVHRDLKPGNILVTNEGEPKLLDFGIAKLIDPDAARTQTGFQALTPSYASPEQVRGEAITTASDVYSLGIVLFELLTGRKPYIVSGASPMEVAQAVCESQPSAPGVSDDLDTILLMALRKEPLRRYASVKEFAEDVERSMSNQPVRARPDTVRYRTQKFLRRNWWQAAAIVGIIVSMGLGLGFTLAEKRVAERRFNEVRELANRFLFDFYDEISLTPGTVKAREMVVSTALKYLNNLSADNGSDPLLQWEMAVAYGKVAEAQGSTTKPSLGRTADAIASYEKAVALARPLVTRKFLNAQQRQAYVRMLCAEAVLRRGQPDLKKAEQLGREAQTVSVDLDGPTRRHALRDLSITLTQMGDLAGSVTVLEGLVGLIRQTVKEQPTDETRRDLATSLLTIGYSQMVAARLDDASKSVSEALGLFRDLSAKNPSNTRTTRFVFMCLMYSGAMEGMPDRPSFERPEAAAAKLEEALEFLSPLLNADSADTATRADAALVHNMIGGALREVQPARGLIEATTAAKMLDTYAVKNLQNRALARVSAADAHRMLGRYPQSDALLNEAERLMSAAGMPPLPEQLLSRAKLELARGNTSAVEARFEEAVQAFEEEYKSLPTPSKAWAVTRALTLAASAVPASAEARRSRIQTIWEEQLRRDPGNRFLLDRARKQQ